MHGNHAGAGHDPTLYLSWSQYTIIMYISVIDMYTPYTQLHQTLHNIVTEEEHYE